MRPRTRWTTCLLLAVAGLLPRGAVGQTLTITNGVHTYTALSATTVTLSGHSELWLTDAAAPLPGSLVNLTSDDAWVILPNILPSVVVSTHLGRFRVNGAAAAVNSNCRVVQYAMGAVVIPHAPAFQPLQVFSGTHFTGPSLSLDQFTLYTGSGLGALDGAISSFKLKRGYMATLAQNTNGTGPSRCYVAQDADLEVPVLPATLDNRFRFVRIFPWRWASKKGIAGNIESGLNLRWKYNWNIDQNSSRDLEYVAIRQNRYWPGLNQNWQSRGINHLLGYNEPDHTDQANLAVGDAIWSWPDLLGTGLRVGAPAVSDGGLSWLYSFMDEADAAGLRVDFVPVHYYRCRNPSDPNGAASQFYDFLKGIYDVVKRPLWVTEWNNGANWTGCGDPSFAQQQAAIAKMIEMLDNTPFVERYALYNWVEDVRRVKWDDGSLTAAGVTYRDKLSPLSYVQEVPETANPGIAQFPFEANPVDSSGHGNNGVAFGLPDYVPGPSGQAIDLDGSRNYVQLPGSLVNDSTSFTFAAWVYWDGGGSWQRIFDFGNGTSQYLFLSPNAAGTQLRFAITTSGGGGEQRLEAGAFPVGQWTHVAVVLTGSRGWLYVNGVREDISSTFTLHPSDVKPAYNYLGKSQFIADPLFNGKLDNVLIADYALSGGAVAALMADRPPQFASSPLTAADGAEELAYSGSIAGAASDPDAGDALAYEKLGGPAWLNVDSTGALSGTPMAGQDGTNTFIVTVTDRAGLSDYAILEIYIEPIPRVGLGNGGFEQPGTADYAARPAGAAWAYRTGSGVAANGGTYTAGNSPAPEGNQVAYLETRGQFSQPLTDFIPGREYTVQFLASQRQNTPGGQLGQTFDVYLGSASIGSFEPPQAVAGYQAYSAPFTATATDLNLTFRSSNLNGGDNTVLIDNVVISGLPLSALPDAPTLLSALPGDGQVDLVWTSVDGAIRYHLKRGAAPSGPYAVIAGDLTTTNHADLAATNGMTHYYVVSAVDTVAESLDSAPLSAHPVSLVPPQLGGASDTNGLAISWPPDHTGWRMQMQTGSLGTNWLDVPDTGMTNWYPVPLIDDNAFFRLTYP